MNEFVNAYYRTIFSESSDWDNLVSETQISFGGKVYPKFGQVVIVSGGPGSGKDFVIDNLFGITGKRYDVDILKNQVKKNKQLRKELSEKYEVDPSVFDLKTAEDISIVHKLVKDSGLKQKYENNIFMLAKNADIDRKPNLIFNKTCKDFGDIFYVTETCKKAGYKPENIHLVWVLNNIETSIVQNKSRSRTISELLIKDIHQKVALTMKAFFDNDLTSELNGDIWIVFNNRENKDIEATPLKLKDQFYIGEANMIKIKDSGKKQIKLTSDLIKNIKNYVPKNTWE